MSSRVESLTFDCASPELLARFWAGALGFELKEANEQSASVRDPVGRHPDLFFLIVPESKAVKNRLHLDLIPPGAMQEEVERLRVLGGTVVRLVEEPGSHWIVMADPEGNEFCVGPERAEPATT